MSLGDEHPDTLTTMSNLAQTLRSLGDLAGARAPHKQARRLPAVPAAALSFEVLGNWPARRRVGLFRMLDNPSYVNVDVHQPRAEGS